MNTIDDSVVAPGRSVTELSDAELEQQGTQAHATRNWVFLHGTATQFARHTERMLALEQEYLRRFPKRTWQGAETDDSVPKGDPVTALLTAVAAQPGGRMHKLEVHQAARVAGVDRTALAGLYTAAEPALITEKDYRVITAAGRALITPVS